MLDLSVIILAFNEEIHIRRCIENVKEIALEIFVVDSFSSDQTVQLAVKSGARVYQNKWENTMRDSSIGLCKTYQSEQSGFYGLMPTNI